MYCPFDRGQRCKNCPVEGYEISADSNALKRCIKFNVFLSDAKLIAEKKTGQGSDE